MILLLTLALSGSAHFLLVGGVTELYGVKTVSPEANLYYENVVKSVRTSLSTDKYGPQLFMQRYVRGKLATMKYQVRQIL